MSKTVIESFEIVTNVQSMQDDPTSLKFEQRGFKVNKGFAGSVESLLYGLVAFNIFWLLMIKAPSTFS
jgi:hypothetical protein